MCSHHSAVHVVMGPQATLGIHQMLCKSYKASDLLTPSQLTTIAARIFTSNQPFVFWLLLKPWAHYKLLHWLYIIKMNLKKIDNEEDRGEVPKHYQLFSLQIRMIMENYRKLISCYLELIFWLFSMLGRTKDVEIKDLRMN